jgi:hypothetical protein
MPADISHLQSLMLFQNLPFRRKYSDAASKLLQHVTLIEAPILSAQSARYMPLLIKALMISRRRIVI